MPAEGLEPLWLPDGLDAGDVILFNRRCSAMGVFGAAVCAGAKLYYNSKWDHIGIVLREPDGSLYLLDAGFGGVRKYPLLERVQRSQADDVCVRRLAVPRSERFRATLLEFANEVIDASYKKKVRDLLRVIKMPNTSEVERLNALDSELEAETKALQKQAHRVAATSQPVLLAELSRIERQREIVQYRLREEQWGTHWPFKPLQERFDAQRGVFCSELVAAAYQRLELLPSFPSPTKYSPNDFSSNADTPLFLSNNVFLGPEEYIKRDGRPMAAPAVPQQCNLDQQLLERALRQTRLEDVLKDERRMRQFVQELTPVVLQPGQVLFSKGDFADGFFIVESGRIERLMKPQGVEDGEEVVVATLRAGASVGLRGMTYDTPRTSTCRAVERTVLWRCDRAAFRKFLVEFVDHKVVRDYTEKRRLYNILCDHFLFKRLDRIPGSEVVDCFFNVEVKAGDVLWTEGSPGDNFYIVKAGEMEVFEHGRLSYTLRPGDTFGASALIFDTPRYYTIVAKTPVTCWAINAHDFHQLHLAENAQHLKRAFESYCTPHQGQKIMTTEKFLQFSRARENFPPEKADRLIPLLIALVTFNRVGRVSPPAAAASPAAPARRPAEPDQIRFFEFVRFHLTIDRPTASLSAEVAFRLIDRNQSGMVNLAELLGFLTEVYGPQAAAEQLANMAVEDPDAMSAWLRAASRPITRNEFVGLYPALPGEVRLDMDLLAQQCLNFVVPALRQTEILERPPGAAPFLTAPPAPRFKYLDRRKLLLMQLSSVFGVVAIAPLERLQILRQVGTLTGRRTADLQGMRSGLTTLWRRDGGLRGWLRGCSAGALRIVPAMGIQYALMEGFSRYFSAGLYKEIAYGAFAGLLAGMATTPFDVLRARAAASTGPTFSLPRHAASVLRHEGVRTLYRGLVPSTLGLFPYVGANFGMYQYYVLQGSGEKLSFDRHMTPTAVVYWASVAYAAHMLVVYPLDTVRRCMQVDPTCGGMRHVMHTIWQEHGVRGFYTGLVPGFLRIVPAMGTGMGAWSLFMGAAHWWSGGRPTLQLPVSSV